MHIIYSKQLHTYSIHSIIIMLGDKEYNSYSVYVVNCINAIQTLMHSVLYVQQTSPHLST